MVSIDPKCQENFVNHMNNTGLKFGQWVEFSFLYSDNEKKESINLWTRVRKASEKTHQSTAT